MKKISYGRKLESECSYIYCMCRQLAQAGYYTTVRRGN